MNSLEQIKQQLDTTLSNPGLFSLVNTRLILKIGVDLRVIDPSKDKDPASIEKVLIALKAMGYSL